MPHVTKVHTEKVDTDGEKGAQITKSLQPKRL